MTWIDLELLRLKWLDVGWGLVRCACLGRIGYWNAFESCMLGSCVQLLLSH